MLGRGGTSSWSWELGLDICSSTTDGSKSGNHLSFKATAANEADKKTDCPNIHDHKLFKILVIKTHEQFYSQYWHNFALRLADLWPVVQVLRLDGLRKGTPI